MLKSLSLFLFLIIYLFPVYAGTSFISDNEYTVRVNDDLSVMQVEACFSSLPVSLFARESGAGKYLLQRPSGYRLVDGRLRQQHPQRGTCIHYVVDLGRVASEVSLAGVPYHDHTNAVTTPGSWLWLPSDNNHPLRVKFILPRSIHVSAPWLLLQRGSTVTEYSLPIADDSHDSIVAIGDFPVETIHVSGAEIRLAVLHGNPPPDTDSIRRWIEYGAESIVGLYGHFPLPDPQVLVFPMGHSDEPVPWGQIQRGGESSIQLFIDQTRPLQELIADWTLTHELAHMTHPYMPMDGRWLTEGIATYYQYVLRARMGTISPQYAWQELDEGFARGRQQTRKGESLLNASINMHDSHEYMRVYWSGAAFALLTDWQLRRAHRGSLDKTLAEFRRCCLPARKKWSTADFVSKLDEISGTDVFSETYTQIINSDRFPSLDRVYRFLGLETGNGHLVIADHADDLAIRTDIMRPDPTRTAHGDSLPTPLLVKSLTPDKHGRCRHVPDI